ncbi:MarR family winged helix-turn-helix transcriptional regulator [Pasteurella oralis]|uniref:MarR family winged helix-turn-helix transcriptional regulator n=1 Tax=Pasteurella oralis TaxID=1071947 RepID=A0ABW4NU74_9PAST|nr:MarR family transcriptional regulator [Pasteurella oralis]
MKYSHYKKTEESTGLLFWQTTVLWQRKIKEVLQPLDLTHTQFVILAVVEELSEKVDEITQKMISDFSMIDVMTVSSTVRLLEKKHYIVRVQSKNDTRAYSICNTTQGKERLIQAIKQVEDVDSQFFFANKQALTQFQEELRTLISNNTNSV